MLPCGIPVSWRPCFFVFCFSNIFPLFVGAHAHALISLWKNDAWKISTEFLLSENTIINIEFQLRNHFQSETLGPLSASCISSEGCMLLCVFFQSLHWAFSWLFQLGNSSSFSPEKCFCNLCLSKTFLKY